MGLAAWVVTRSGRARPVCDSGRGSGIREPGVPPATGSRGSGLRRVRAPPGPAAAADARGPGHRGLACGLAGAARAAGSVGERTRGRDAERADAKLSPESGRCAQLHSRRSPARPGHSGRENFVPAEPSRDWEAAGAGGGGRRGVGQARFVSFYFLRQPLEMMRTAGPRRSGRGPRE